MSEADKMFEEAGYIKTETNKELGYINEEGTEFILFLNPFTGCTGICIHKDNTEYPALSVLELQAISKKCEELGCI